MENFLMQSLLKKSFYVIFLKAPKNKKGPG